nr:hypothetical protein [Tanacetum cinerariifolium]
MPRACVLYFGGSWNVHLSLVEFSYNSSYHSSVRRAPFEALYDRKCRSPILRTEVGGGQLLRPKNVQKTIEKISQIKDRLLNLVTKPLESSKGNHVLLKVSLWESVVRFGKKDKLAPSIHDTLHVSNLKKCLADPTLQIPLEEFQVDAKLNFVAEPVEILERKFKKLMLSKIHILNVETRREG